MKKDRRRSVGLFVYTNLLGTKQTVTGIAYARNDIALVVELLVDGCAVDVNIRMLLLNYRR